MEEINLTITPLSFDEFKAKYQEQYSRNEYKKYLIANTTIHHYNGLTLEEWFKENTHV